MKHTALALALVLAPMLPAQKPGSVEARLVCASDVIVAGAEARFTLTVTVLEDTSVDATVMRGVHLKRKIDGGKEVTIGSKVSGNVKVVAGTTITREFKTDLQVMATAEQAGTKRITVMWPNLPGATASLQVVPDASKVSMDKLDLAKTQVMLVTNYGTMTVKFFADKAPNHVKNFIELAKTGFYDGTQFHRILRGFMIQGGCPNTKAGADGPPGTGNRADGKLLAAEFNDTRHVRGVLSAARTNDPNSASCQFFVCHGNPSHLDGQYTAFGQLVKGDTTLEKIANVAVGGAQRSTPVNPVHLHRAIVLPAIKQ